MEDTSETNPNDISYVHSVYAPLSVRIAEQVTKHDGWKQLQDVVGLLSGSYILNLHKLLLTSHETGNAPLDVTQTMGNGTPNAGDSPKVVLVFFIGGCTFAEVGLRKCEFCELFYKSLFYYRYLP